MKVQPQSTADDPKWCRIRASNDLQSSVHIVLPEVLDLRYRDILAMFKQSIERSGISRIIIDFSENIKLMESGWVVLSNFIQYLESNGRCYQFVSFNEACSELFVSFRDYHRTICVDFAKQPYYPSAIQEYQTNSKPILN